MMRRGGAWGRPEGEWSDLATGGGIQHSAALRWNVWKKDEE
jgi:hypothetical protein